MDLDVAELQGTKQNGCVCPGDIVTYKCTITGRAADSTIWTGSALKDCGNDQIILVHSRFSSAHRTVVTCNNGTIVGWSLHVENNTYTSQLIVTVTHDTAKKTIKCGHDNGENILFLFSSVIPTITGLSCTAS